MKYYNQQEVAQRIKQARIVAGMTQSELAEVLDVTDISIYRMENGKWGHSVDKLVEIAQILHISLDYLLLGTESGREETEPECGLEKAEKIFQEIVQGKGKGEVIYALKVLESILSHTELLLTELYI